MEKEFTAEQLREIESQLSNPCGPNGIEMGERMNESNFGMTMNSIEFLDLQSQNKVLELGHGNCGHLPHLLNTADNLHYYGLEISELMWAEAGRKNQQLMIDGAIEFKLYDGENIPYPDHFFDRVMTVNTLYFWPKPVEMLNEIALKLKPGGLCIVAFALKDSMKKLPFIGRKFNLYDVEDMKRLAGHSAIELIEMKDKSERVESKSGDMVDRQYAMAKLRKP